MRRRAPAGRPAEAAAVKPLTRTERRAGFETVARDEADDTPFARATLLRRR